VSLGFRLRRNGNKEQIFDLFCSLSLSVSSALLLWLLVIDCGADFAAEWRADMASRETHKKHLGKGSWTWSDPLPVPLYPDKKSCVKGDEPPKEEDPSAS
jgi:hypothetical protein